jgi:hypothetical protein
MVNVWLIGAKCNRSTHEAQPGRPRVRNRLPDPASHDAGPSLRP